MRSTVNGLAADRRDVVADGRLEGERPVVRVAHDAHERDRLGRFGGDRLPFGRFGGWFGLGGRRLGVGRHDAGERQHEKRDRGQKAVSSEHGGTRMGYFTCNSSISKINVSLGPILGGAPRCP